MSVSLFRCHACDSVFDASKDMYGSCDGCHRAWCCTCDQKISIFMYGADPYCDLCFERGGSNHHTDAALLKKALERLQMNREELEFQLDQDGEPLKCTQCGDVHCLDLDEAYEDENISLLRVSYRKGICCKCLGMGKCFECK